MSQTINIRRRATSTVPDDILTNSRLSWAARVVLGWMLGRSPEFELHVWYVRKTFKLTERQWVRIRRELEQEGYYLQSKEQDEETGKFKWTNIVSDKQEFRPSLQTPPPPKPLDGQPSDGERGDIPVVSHTNSINTTTTVSQQSVFSGGDLFSNLDIEPVIEPYRAELLGSLRLAGVADVTLAQDLLDELAGTIEAGSKGERPKVGNPTAWLMALAAGDFKRSRCYEIQKRRKALQENQRRRQSMEAPIPLDPVAQAIGDKVLAGIRRRREHRECQVDA